METCRHCGAEFTKKPSHYRVCAGYKSFIAGVRNTLTEEYLRENYLAQGKSLKELVRILGLEKPRLIKAKLADYGIKERTLQEAKKMIRHVELARATSLERYGVEYHLQTGSPLLAKSVATSLERYGTERACQSDEVKNRIKKTNMEHWGYEYASSSPVVRERVRAASMSKYGVDHHWKAESVIRKCQETKGSRPSSFVRSSAMSDTFFDAVFARLPEELREHVYYSNHRGEFGVMCPETHRYLYFDFVATSVKIAVEFHGSYYHADPSKYAADWVNKKRKGMTAAEIWERDSRRARAVASCGSRRTGRLLRIGWWRHWFVKFANDSRGLRNFLIFEVTLATDGLLSQIPLGVRWGEPAPRATDDAQVLEVWSYRGVP